MQIDFIFSIAVLIMSVIVHEVAHGLAAYALGDQTAKYEGRLTLNPIRHLDPIGSILVPLLSYQVGGFIFGWAKPVPYNPYNLSDQRFGELKVAAAGPASNLLLALIFGLILRFGAGILPGATENFLALVVLVNLVLAVFNLIPVPPLDGSKILYSVLPYRYQHIRQTLETYGFILVLAVVFFAWQFIFPLVSILFSLITGLA